MEPSDERMVQHTTLFQRLFRFIRHFFIWFFLIIVILWSYGFYELGRYVVYQENPGLAGQQQADAILQKVGRLIELPANETPTMVTITNAASVKQTQPFLANAENGDVLIIYTTDHTAILYRPSQNKLIAVGPVTQQTASQPTTVVPPSTTTPTITTHAITNATTKK